MKSGEPGLKIRKLTAAERLELKRREAKYRNKLARQGYVAQAVADESGCFGLVLVIEPKSHRRGVLLPDGRIRWIDQAMQPGALAEAVVTGITAEGFRDEKPT